VTQTPADALIDITHSDNLKDLASPHQLADFEPIPAAHNSVGKPIGATKDGYS
jgi:hypothetical protein